MFYFLLVLNEDGEWSRGDGQPVYASNAHPKTLAKQWRKNGYKVRVGRTIHPDGLID